MSPGPATASLFAATLLAIALSGCAASPGAAPAQTHAGSHTSSPSPSVSMPTSASPAPGDAAPAAPAAGAIEVAVSDTSFSPSELNVAVGDTITVTNVGQLEHSWTFDDAGVDSGVLGPGESYTFTVHTPGTFGFYCSVHPTMTGTITIN